MEKVGKWHKRERKRKEGVKDFQLLRCVEIVKWSCEMRHMCAANNLSLNIKQTREIVIDFRRQQEKHLPLRVGDVKRVTSFKFLGTQISEDHKWTVNCTPLVKKDQQRLYFLRLLRRTNLSAKLLESFQHCSLESVLMTASRPGMECVQRQTGRFSRGLSTQNKK